MEYAAGGDMFEYVVRKGGLRESEARWFFQQLIVAVDYIHRMVRAPHQGRHPAGCRGCRGTPLATRPACPCELCVFSPCMVLSVHHDATAKAPARCLAEVPALMLR